MKYVRTVTQSAEGGILSCRSRCFHCFEGKKGQCNNSQDLDFDTELLVADKVSLSSGSSPVLTYFLSIQWDQFAVPKKMFCKWILRLRSTSSKSSYYYNIDTIVNLT